MPASLAHPNRGFTLIELLVVVAIIGLLSSVVLASLNTARSRGNDAAIKSSLNGARSQAELFHASNNGSYDTVCTSGAVAAEVKGVYDMVLAAARASGLTAVTVNGASGATVAICNHTAAGWAAQVPLRATANTWQCVDSAGSSHTVTTNRIGAAGDILCSS